MSSTLEASLSAKVKDLSFVAEETWFMAKDLSATSHDYVDRTPRVVSTAGAVGAAFSQLETPVAQVQRMIVDLRAGADVVMRLSGAVAKVTGGTSAPTFSGGETLVLNVDGAGNVTTTFEAGDNTLALAVKRINYAHGLPVASLVANALTLSGSLTGGAAAEARGWQRGKIVVVSGSALSALGLTAGTTYGAGDDLRLGAGMQQFAFATGALPTRVELSGSASASRFVIAGKAS